MMTKESIFDFISLGHVSHSNQITVITMNDGQIRKGYLLEQCQEKSLCILNKWRLLPDNDPTIYIEMNGDEIKNLKAL